MIIRTPFDAVSMLDYVARRKRENFGIILMNNNFEVIAKKVMFVGTAKNCIVGTRELLVYALKKDASMCILFHNHPTGNCEPSEPDINATKKFQNGCKSVGIILQTPQQLVRHIVRIHLRVRGERGGVETALHLHLILARRRLRRFAVEEARDMAELLRLRETQLADTGAGDDLAQQVVHSAAGAHRTEKIVGKLIPVAGKAEIDDLRADAAGALIVIADERLR